MAIDAVELEREAARSLADALGQVHEPGKREHHRQALERTIQLAHDALSAAENEYPIEDGNGQRIRSTMAGARSTLAKAYAARAEDARHGADQLSLSAQRAPTRQACDDGWRRVESIVVVAEEAARTVKRLAEELDNDVPSAHTRAARAAARMADAAATEARRFVDERNHAYTFHTDTRFSFGEGWYVAAAAVLDGITIQIEPRAAGTVQADQFLREAGLHSQLQAYRSRPRAVKQTTDIVARAFKANPTTAQQKLRGAFLGESPVPKSVIEWIDGRLARAPADPKVLLWIRDGHYDIARNTTPTELTELARRARAAGLVPILVGDAIPGPEIPDGTVDMTLFWRDPIFQGTDARRAQLQFFEHLRRAHGLVGQLGVTTAGMDGPALMGLATMYLTETSNVRMREWVGAVPRYHEVVRDGGYLERISSALEEWVASAPRT